MDASRPPRTDALTGLLLPGEWNRILADEEARIDRYGRPATVVFIELDGLDRLVGGARPGAGDRILPAPSPTPSAATPAAPTTSRASVPVASGSCCRRPARSRRSTTSSASARPASSGSNRARSRSAWPSAGPPRRRREPRRRLRRWRRTGCSPSFAAARGATGTDLASDGPPPAPPGSRGAPSPRLTRRQSRPCRSARPGRRAGVDAVGDHERAGRR